MTLTRGSIGIEDAVQIEGSTPPIVGIVTGLWESDGATAERITKQGLFGTRLVVRIEGIDPSWFRTAGILVPAPVGAVPSTEPQVQTGAFPPSPQPIPPADLPEIAQQLLRSLQGNGDTTRVQTVTSSSGTTYSARGDGSFWPKLGQKEPSPLAHTTTPPNPFSFHTERDGQPIQTYDQETADGIGPILMNAGANPAAVIQTLQQWCALSPDSAQTFLASLPAPIPDPHPLNESFVDGLAAAFRQAGAEVLSPGPDAPIRALARKASSEINGF